MLRIKKKFGSRKKHFFSCAVWLWAVRGWDLKKFFRLSLERSWSERVTTVWRRSGKTLWIFSANTFICLIQWDFRSLSLHFGKLENFSLAMFFFLSLFHHASRMQTMDGEKKKRRDCCKFSISINTQHLMYTTTMVNESLQHAGRRR